MLGFVVHSQAQTGSSGTDATTGNYGYSWMNSAATGGPAYEWIDISSTGTALTGLGDDNVVGPISLGIDFKYYWNTYNSCYVASNGYIMFDDNQLIAQGSSGMPQIPFAADNKGNFIAGLLGDLTFVRADNGAVLPGAKVMYATVGDKFVITYDSVRFWNNSAASGTAQANGMINFQIVLNSTDNTISINYKKVQGPWFTGNANWGTFGMENVTGQLGLRWRRNPTTANIPNLTTYKITPPANPTYQFRDVKARALFSQDNKGGTVFKNNPTNLKAYVQNAGTVKIKTPITAKIFIFDEQENDIFNSTLVLDSLQVGETRLITFPNAFTATDVQRLAAQLTLTMTGDQLTGNNNNDVKLMVLDTSSGLVDIRFTKQNIGDVTDPSFSRKGGMVLDAPYYPFSLKKVSIDVLWPDSAFISQNTPDFKDSLSTTLVEVYLGDGPGNSRGSLIDSFRVQKSLAGADYDTVGTLLSSGTPSSYFFRFYRTLPAAYNWTDKPIYVGFNHESNTGFIWNGPYIEVDATRPASNRALEITGGIWGEDRGKDSTDYAVSLIGTITPENSNIVLKAGSTVLANNSVLNVGLTEVGVAVDSTIILENSGTDTLRITSATISGSGWSLVAAPASKIAPGASTSIKVRYNAPAAGIANSDLFISTNDPDLALAVLKFTGRAEFAIAWSPAIPNVETDSLKLVYNAALGNKALTGQTEVFVHTGIVTSGPTGTNWEYVQGTWGTNADSVKLVPLGDDRYLFKVKINEFYNLPGVINAYRIGMVFRNADGSKVGKTRADGDFFIRVVSSTTETAQQLADREVSIFPNPVQDELNITLPDQVQGNLSAMIVNSLGQKVSEVRQDQINKISVSELKSGVYTLIVKSNSFSVSRRFVKN